jgi:hypothetical protein
MDAPQEARKLLLLRKARRARELGPFIDKLSAASGLAPASFRFLSIEETDPVRAAFYDWYKEELPSRDKLTATWSEPEPLERILADMGSRIDDNELLLFFQDADVLGALVMPSRDLWTRGGRLLLGAGDCVCVLDRSEPRSGVYLDFYENGASGTWLYEIVAWGRYRVQLEQSLARLDPAKLLAPPDLRS